MFVIKTMIEGELRKNNGDFNIRSEYDTVYIKEEDISRVVNECMMIVKDDCNDWEIPKYDQENKEYDFGNGFDVWDNVYPDIEVYWINDKLWSKFEELDIIPEMKDEWMISGFCISGAIEDEIELNTEYFYQELFINNIKKWDKEFEGCGGYDNDKILGG